MSIRTKHIRNVVEHLLLKNNINSVPIDVTSLAETLGAIVEETPTNEGLSGFLLRSSGTEKVVIGVNKNHHLNRRRFTIAHEIGHLLLHEGEPLYIDRDCGFRIKLRHEEASQGLNKEEIEANEFAAELLMPSVMLDKELMRYNGKDALDETVIATIAKKFQVSQQALIYRLINLKLISGMKATH